MSKYTSITEAIIGMYKDPEVNDITYKDIESLPVGEWLDIGLNVRSRKIASPYHKGFVFYVEFSDQGGMIYKHMHSDCKEVVTIIEGNADCSLYHMVPGGRYFYQRGIVHEIKSTGHCKMIVEFVPKT